jgi:hypothetical protein
VETINERMKAGQPSEEQAPQEQQPTDPTAVTPEEQQAYEQVVLAGVKMLTDDATHQGILQMLQQGADVPAEAIAKVTTMIVLQIDEQSGNNVPEAVILPAAGEILENVAEFASKMFEVNQQIIDQATDIMVMDLAQEYGVEAGDVEEMMAMFSEEEINEAKTARGVQQPAGGAA